MRLAPAGGCDGAFLHGLAADGSDIAIAEGLVEHGAQLDRIGDPDAQRQLICAYRTMRQVKLAQQPRFELVP